MYPIQRCDFLLRCGVKLAAIGPVAEGPRPTFVAAHPRLHILHAVDDDTHAGRVIAYAADPAGGELALVQQIGCGGENPWSFVPHGSGRWLLVANQKSGGLSVFAVEPATGRLRDAGQTVAVPAPVSLAFLT